MQDDTIAAIATPIGEGGLGIVRLSGPQARAIVASIFTASLKDRRVVYGRIVSPGTSETVDEVLVTFMKGPHSYTREDVAEISCHGGPLPLQRTLELALAQGARLANPGEFTLRAFLNGRLDLAQAEAVLDVIQAKTAASLRLAMNGLQGKLSDRIALLRQSLIGILAYLTARIDFPDDDVPPQDVSPEVTAAADELRRLIESADAGMIYRQGVRTAIVGRPNVGKSSLLNRLLRENRAIVAEVPGTTRDTLEETINLRGLPVVLTDTAGIGETSDPVGRLGIERSQTALRQADFLLLVLDQSEPLTPQDRELVVEARDRPHLVVLNKADLPRRLVEDGLPSSQARVSALTGQGIEELEETLFQAIVGQKIVAAEETLVTNPRHKEALSRALAHTEAVLEGMHAGATEDLLAVDLTDALNALGEITGQTVTEDLLDAIFSRFCIGK